MTLPTTLPQLVIDALRSAGATEEMIAAAVKASGEFPTPQAARRGRPRKYADDAARKRDWKRGTTKRATKSVRGDEKGDEIPTHLGGAYPPGDEKGDENHEENKDKTSQTRMPRDQIPFQRAMDHLRGRLEEAGQGNFDADADVAPIRALLDQGCDLEADILPIIAREVPELPRPIKKWGAPWLVREILAARAFRLNPATCAETQTDTNACKVEAPPPTQRVTPAIEWDEFVGGYRAGLIKWNTARLGPKPGEPGCRAPAEVLREHGY
jgi:hypothetical protein